MREAIRGDEGGDEGGNQGRAGAIFISTHTPGDDDVINRTAGKELEGGACT
jgi:hypothetical protein